MSSGGPPPSSPRRVLIVDDDSGIRRSLTTAFEVREWRVDAFGDAESALRAVPGLQVDVAVVDKVLPGMSGLELVRRLRQLGFEFPVLLATGTSDVQSARELLTLKLDGHLSKPFDDVFEVVRRAEALAEREERARDQQRRREALRPPDPPAARPPVAPPRGGLPPVPPPGAKPVRLPGTSHLPKAEAARGRRVLVVDDEPAVRTSLKTVFEADGWDVSDCADGERALALAKRGHFDLLLVDKNLPGAVSGIDVIRLVREGGNRAPIILVTAFPSVESALSLMPYRIDAYVVKPFGDVYEVVQRGRATVERHERSEAQRKARQAAWERRMEENDETPASPPPAADWGLPPPRQVGPRFVVANAAPDGDWMARELQNPSGRPPLVRSHDELLRQVAAHPADVVLLDLSLARAVVPTLEALRALTAPPIVLVTGDRPPLAMLPSLIGAGAAGFIEKPYGEGAAFRRRISSLLAPLAAPDVPR